jgi:hypothetical protein
MVKAVEIFDVEDGNALGSCLVEIEEDCLLIMPFIYPLQSHIYFLLRRLDTHDATLQRIRTQVSHS